MGEILLLVAAFAVFLRHLSRLEPVHHAQPAPALAPKPTATRITQLSDYADRLFVEKKWLAAEKAYLSVLKVDHKNVTAYSHLGIIYSTQKSLPDAIECFTIATRIKPSGSTYQNLALAFFDNKNYIKSIAAFKKAIMFEPTSQRYVGLSRAQQKLGATTEAVETLKTAVKLDDSPRVKQLLAEAEAAPLAGPASTQTKPTASPAKLPKAPSKPAKP
jgi:tetratricopeptide (TPR) repeat protein